MSDIIERLRNPAWEELPGNSRRLHIDRTLADMSEAADEIVRLRAWQLAAKNVAGSAGQIYLAYKDAPPTLFERLYTRLWGSP